MPNLLPHLTGWDIKGMTIVLGPGSQVKIEEQINDYKTAKSALDFVKAPNGKVGMKSGFR